MIFAKGSSAGKYRILREIGRGGMGVVFLAEDTTLERQVALKVLEKNLVDPEQFEFRFRQEARMLAKLQHPNIVYIHALEKIDGIPVIDMPYIENGALLDLLRDRIVRYEYILKLIREVLHALDCCHREGIIHRDVKPSNILIGRDERALLTDFGLAKLMEEQQALCMREATSSGMFLGTPSYAPPELWDNAPPTASWDVYSVGVVLYECLTGIRPHAAETPFALMKQMIAQSVQPVCALNTAISSQMSDAVMTMIETDPAKRPKHAGEALELLGQADGIFNQAVLNEPTLATRKPTGTAHRKNSLLRARHSVTARLRLTQWATVMLLLVVTAWGVWQWIGYFSQAEERSPASAAAPLAPNAPRTFDTVDSAVPQVWANHVLIWPTEEPKIWTGLAWEGTHLWFFRKIAMEKEELRFEGDWAEYADKTATRFRQGALTGQGRWVKSNQQIAAVLEFQDSGDGTRDTRPILLSPAEAPLSEVAYMRRFSESSFMPPLFFNEVAARGLSWATLFESDVLGRTYPLLRVPKLAREAKAPAIDGALAEPAWQIAYPSIDERMRGVPSSLKGTAAHLMMLYGGTGLYIGLDFHGALQRPRVTLSVIDEFRCPAQRSPHWSFSAEGDALQSGIHSASGKEETWLPHGRSSMISEGGVFQAEIFLSFEEGQSPAQPAPGTIWRINCAISEAAAPGIPKAAWGDADPYRPETGCISVFSDVQGG